MEGTPNGFDIRAEDPSIESTRVLNYAKEKDLDSDISEEMFAIHAPITEHMAGPWTEHLYNDDGEYQKTLGYEGVIDNQYAINDESLRLEIVRELHIKEEIRISKSEMVPAGIFNDDGTKKRDYNETRYHLRNKEIRDAFFLRCIDWIKKASKAQLNKHMPRLWQQLRESRANCKTKNEWSKVLLTKTQATLISTEVKKKLG